MTMIYHQDDGDLAYLAGKPVGVIGYGSLGRAFALNLRDSGVQVIVGGRSEASRETAEADGLTATSIEEAARAARILLLLMPDEVMPAVYLESVAPHLRRGDMLVFASAYNVAFGYIEAPPFVDVGLIAPRLMAAAVRERFEAGAGYCSYVAVGQDASGQAWRTLLALARAVGALEPGAIEVSFEQEAALDLFIQQTVMPVLHDLLDKAARLLISRGFPPEAVLTELYLSGEFAAYLHHAEQRGLVSALRQTPPIAQYGILSRVERFSDLKLDRLLEVTLDEIQAGNFAREWTKERQDNHRRLNQLLKAYVDPDLLDWEQQTLESFGRVTEPEV